MTEEVFGQIGVCGALFWVAWIYISHLNDYRKEVAKFTGGLAIAGFVVVSLAIIAHHSHRPIQGADIGNTRSILIKPSQIKVGEEEETPGPWVFPDAVNLD